MAMPAAKNKSVAVLFLRFTQSSLSACPGSDPAARARIANKMWAQVHVLEKPVQQNTKWLEVVEYCQVQFYSLSLSITLTLTLANTHSHPLTNCYT